MTVLKIYETQSGQKINGDKSAFYLHQNVVVADTILVKECTGFNRGQFSLKYLGCPIAHTRKRKEHYSNLIGRIKAKLQF